MGGATYLIRDVTAVTEQPSGVVCTLRGVGCSPAPGMPGYLTGESADAQGVETTLPNLPDLELPAYDERTFELRVRTVSTDTVRLTLAAPGAPALEDDGTALGIVTDPAPEQVTTRVRPCADSVVVETGGVRVTVGRRPFRLEVADVRTGAVVMRTAEHLRQAAGLAMAPAVLCEDDRTTVHLELSPDEDVLGFGEQFSRLVKNGQHLVLRCEDALGTGTGLAYKPVPVWHSSRGYTGFLNTGAVVSADVGHRRPSVLGLSLDDDAVDLYVTVGRSPRERLSSYTALTGRASVPPVWSFGYWMGRCRYHSRAEMLEVADAMNERGVPCDVLHLDPDWLVVDRLNCDFVWNEHRFGARRAFVQALAERGIRLSVWELPYLDPASPRYDEARERGFLVVGPDGEPVSVAKTPTPDGRPRGLVDFTDDEAVTWWASLHREFVDDGVAVFKTDFGEGLPDTARLSDGTPSRQAHNLYPLRYNGAVSDALGALTGRAPLVWGRSGWAGSHRYPGQWGGDAESTVAGMQATVRGGLSYALCAPGLWSHDIGGFFGPDLTPELYVRWTQLGALSPLMRAHGLRPREPWAFGEQALTIARDWVRLRYSLLPYLWQSAHESLAHGWPMMRPLAMEFPDDPVATGLDDQYMLGPDLLVVPVFDDSPVPAPRRFYVPEGRWVDLLTGEGFTGPAHHTRTVPLERIPVLVREGTTVPRVEVDPSVRSTDDLIGRPWTLHQYGKRPAVAELGLVGFDGTTARVTVEDGHVTSHGDLNVRARAVSTP